MGTLLQGHECHMSEEINVFLRKSRLFEAADHARHSNTFQLSPEKQGQTLKSLSEFSNLYQKAIAALRELELSTLYQKAIAALREREREGGFRANSASVV